jgi:DNA repair ATPase RecN
MNNDRNYIDQHLNSFVSSLHDLVSKLDYLEQEEKEQLAQTQDIVEDQAYLQAQLKLIQQALPDYDDTKAYELLDQLAEKPWKQDTKEALENIREMLFLHSDFEGAAEEVEKLMEKCMKC